MTNRTDAARGREIVARWCALAEARLEHLTELFESGRWRRYHSEVSFLENVQEAKQAVETWRELLRREASLDNSPIDISWLGRGHVTPLPTPVRLQQRPVERPAPVAPPEPPIEIVALMQAVEEEAPAPEEAPLPLLDLAAIQARYPLLRNTL
ncbi:TIGR03809 family protein [Bradyrhizobium sp. Leo121]|uniref:TIGR03809 family protein n=1 Tax=Bradyrhizobium sp. Leo121 TaxID=1571195 RepID=UPI0010290CFE|nr:TIGR03809 family protein [Bradyrhizobium sp. Leo121]RZN18852.1 TIGR03809 family protein [Bradyrhizobium sp. Leo121]